MKDELLKIKPYSLSQKEKEEKILSILREGIKRNLKNKYIASYYGKIGLNIDSISSLKDIPFLSSSMFKKFDLFIDDNKIVRVLESSSTTSQKPSKIYLDKLTSFRQSIALTNIISDFLGKERIPMLVFDLEEVDKSSGTLTARGAGIRGFSNFASEIFYVLKKDKGEIILDYERIEEFYRKYSDSPCFAFGFTYLIWEILSREEATHDFVFKNMKVFHGGGWKKLEKKKISKDRFNLIVSNFLGCDKKNVHDFYGMVEQTGVIFIDCEEGNKHVPVFSDILIRDFYTLEPTDKEGLINVLSIIPYSYPGQSILTEDKGIILGKDDCKCGRKGKYFKFTSRIKKAEIRGCGDTMPNL